MSTLGDASLQAMLPLAARFPDTEGGPFGGSGVHGLFGHTAEN